MLYLQNYKEFEAEILDLQLEKYGLSFDIKNVLLPVEPRGMRMWSAYTSLNILIWIGLKLILSFKLILKFYDIGPRI